MPPFAVVTDRVGDGTASAYSLSEIPDEIRAVRARATGTGELLYNATAALKRSNGAVAASMAPLYAARALVPAYSWLGASPPATPALSVSGRTVQFTPAASSEPRWWAIRVLAGGTWTTRVLFGDQRSLTLDADPQRVILNAVDQAGNASADASWRLP